MMMNADGDRHLYAVDLAVICMAFARQEKLDDAREWMAKLEVLMADQDVRLARGVAALYSEATGLLE